MAYFRGRKGLGVRLCRAPSRRRVLDAACPPWIAVRSRRRGWLHAAADAAEDWKQLMEVCSGEAPERVVYLWTLDEPSETDPVLMGTGPLLQLTQAIELTRPTAKLRIDMVTRGAQPVGRDMNSMVPAQAPAIGLLRVMCSEHPNFLSRRRSSALGSPRTKPCSGRRCSPMPSARSPFEEKPVMPGDSRGRPQEEQWLDSKPPSAGLARTRASRHAPFCSLPDAILRAAAGVD